jgi:hypothetical protein
MTKQKKQRQKQIQGFFATLRMTSGEFAQDDKRRGGGVVAAVVFVILPIAACVMDGN